ncbi:MAG: putative metal-binding motif-containing protein [Myxococcales bacterium]|nr:putative metal-binding motif-containing protein [Myxococcales bacterium]
MPMIRPTTQVLRSLAVTLALGAVMTGCPQKTEGGLLLKLVVEAPVRANCLQVTVTDNGRVRSRSMTPRLPMQNEYFVGIARSDFPPSLSFQASAFEGRSCMDESDWKLSSRSEEKTQAFPATGVVQFELTIGQPDATLDADRDTYVDTGKGGTDCNDMDAMVNPGAMQVCSSSVDTNCNGKLFCNDATCANTAACLQPATGLAFETSLSTLVAFDCSGAVAVQSVANGMPAAVTSDTTLTLVPTGTAAPGVQLFSDSTCTTALVGSTLPLAFGTTRATFSFRAPTAGALTLTASAPGLGSTTLNTAITDRPVASLSLTPMAVSARAGACSSAVQVTALDDRGMPTNVGTAGLMLGVGYLPAGTNTVEVFTDAACTPPMMGAPPFVPFISAGTSSTQFFVKGSRATPAGAPIQVQLSSPTVNNGTAASLELTVTPGDAQRLEFTASVLGLRNAVCSTAMAEVELRDANGNVTTAGPSGVSVMLSYTPPGSGGTLEFFSAAGCTGTATATVTIPANASRVGVYLRANAPGTYGVTATGMGLAMPTSQLQVDVATMDPTALVFPSPTARVSVGAGSCSAGVRLQTRETNSTSSPVSPVPANVVVTLSASTAGAAEFFSDANCLMALTNNQLTLNAGSSEATFHFRGRTARDFTLSASAATLSTTTPPQNARITPAPTSKLVFQPPTTVSALANDCNASFGLVAFDTFDNPTYANGPITPLATPSVALPAGVAFSTTSACTSLTATVPMADGGVTFFARAQRAQQYTISATGISSSTTMSATFTVDAGPPSALRVLTNPPNTVSAGPASCAPVQIERLDGFGNPSPGGAQAFTVVASASTIASVHEDLASCTNGVMPTAFEFLAGETRATFYVRGRRPGATTFTAASASAMATTMSMTVQANVATQLRFATGTPATTSSVGACAQATVERLDVEGNLTILPTNLMATVTGSGPGSMGGLLLAAGGACGSTMQSSVGLSFGTANFRTFSYEPRATGLLSFDVTGTGLTTASGSTTVGAGAVARVRFVAQPTAAQQWGGCAQFELEALDLGNNRVTTATAVTLLSSAMGAFYGSTDCTGATSTSVMVPANATVTFSYRPQPVALGMTTVTATPATGMAATSTFNVAAGAEARLERSGFPAMMTTADTCLDFTVRRVDGGGNAAVGALRTVAIAASGAASMAPNEAQLFTVAGCMGTAGATTVNVDIMPGASTATFSVRVRKAGALTIAAASMPLIAPMDTTTTVTAGPLAALAFATTPPATLTTNLCSPIITVTGTDQYGNPAAIGTQTLTMASATFSSMPGCAMADTITELVAGTATTASFHLRNSTAGPAVLTVGTTVVTPPQNWVINPPPVTSLRFKAQVPTNLARFACSGPYRLESTDGSVAVNSGVPRTITFSGSGLQYFSDPACATPTTTTSLGAASSETADFYVVALGTTSATLTADALPALTQATAPVTITGTAGALTLVAAQSSTHLEYRGCVSMTVHRQVGTNTAVAGFATQLNLTKSGTAGASATSYHLSSTCADAAVTTATIEPSESFVTLYVAGHSAAPTGPNTAATATLTATDAFAGGFGADNEVFTVYPAVRRGSCTIANSESSSNVGSSTPCAIALALPPTAGVRNRSFFTFQATMAAGGNSGDDLAVRCSLNAGATGMDCARDGNNTVVNIEWQLLSFGTGVTVEHIVDEALTATPQTRTVALTTPAPRAGTFFLASYSTDSGGNLDFDDFPAMALVGPSGMPFTGLEVRNSFDFSPAFLLNIQVVTWTNLAVESGTESNSAGATWAGNPLTSPVGTHALLATNRIATGSTTNAVCRHRLRGNVNSSTGAIAFSRSAGGAANPCTNVNMAETVWYRLSFPASLATVSTPSSPLQTNAVATQTWNLGRLVPHHRSWSFFAGQGPSGQSAGETDRNSGDDLGCSLSRLTLGDVGADSIVTLTRGTTTSNATFSPFLVVLAE